MITSSPTSKELESLLKQYDINRSELARLAGYSYNTICMIFRDEPGYTFCPVRFCIVKYLLSKAEEYLSDAIETFMHVKNMRDSLEFYNCLA